MSYPPIDPNTAPQPIGYYVQTPTEASLDTRFRAKMTLSFLIPRLILDLISLPALFFPVWMHDRMATPSAPGVSSELIAIGCAACMLGLVNMACGITSIVFLCMFVHRANRCARACGAHAMEFSPGWAVGWWFIPFANLVMPYRVMSELWRASEPGTAPGLAWKTNTTSFLIPIWWSLWILGSLINIVPAFLGFGDPHPAKDILFIKAILQTISVVIVIFAGILLVVLVQRLNTRLTDRRRAFGPQAQHPNTAF